MVGTSGPTNKTGSISATETWGLDESPFIITGDITLSSDVDIYVEAGVEIRVEKEAATITLGTNSIFEFGGTKEMPIRIHAAVANRQYWTGFVMGTFSRLWAKYTTFEDAALLIAGGLVNDSVWLEHCIARNNYKVIEQTTNGLDLALRDCVFEGNDFVLFGTLEFSVDSDILIHSDDQVTECIFTKNERAIYNNGGSTCDLRGHDNRFYRNRKAIETVPGGTGTIKLENCWWGSDSGPNDAVNNPTGTGDIIEDDGGVDIDYTPFTRLGHYVPIVDDLREFVNRILREGTPSGEESLATIVDDDELGRFLRRAERTFDSWHTEEFLEKTLFGYGEETNETRDRHSHDANFFRMRYRPIIDITSFQRRTGTSSWTSVSENEISGYYSSESERRQGQVFLALITTLFERDTIRVTYTHGYLDIPEEIRDIVIKIAALEAFQAILRVGEEDVFADRLAALQTEIEWSRDNLRR